MLPNLDFRSVLLVTVLGASLVNARSGTEVGQHSHTNVVCEPTKCPAHCPKGSAGYHYYYESTKTCLRCICGRPNGPADCGEDIDPTLCDSVNIDLSEECGKNSTVKQSCLFSCSVSGQLWWSASKGKLEEMNTAIATGANPTCQRAFPVNSYYSPNMTALHLAAFLNHSKMIATLLNAAVDINQQSTDGRTASLWASWNGSIDALQVLIEHKADVNLADNDGYTPLIIAAAGLRDREELSVVKALITANASLDVTGGDWNATALYYAVLNDNTDIALLLIEHNADVNLADLRGMTPLMRAVLEGHLSVVKALINANASLEVTGGSGNATALYYAARRNNPEIALLLIEHNADVNIAGSDGFTPLTWAAWKGQLNVAKALIDANASLDVTGGWGNATALYYAIHSYEIDIALLLIEHNADVNIAASIGFTPLMGAVLQGQLNVVKALINANASLDVTRGWDNATALHYAARFDKQDVALLLLQSGADAMITDEDGRTPAESAKHYENYELADLIENYSSTNTTEDIVTGS